MPPGQIAVAGPTQRRDGQHRDGREAGQHSTGGMDAEGAAGMRKPMPRAVHPRYQGLYPSPKRPVDS